MLGVDDYGGNARRTPRSPQSKPSPTTLCDAGLASEVRYVVLAYLVYTVREIRYVVLAYLVHTVREVRYVVLAYLVHTVREVRYEVQCYIIHKTREVPMRRSPI